MKYLNTLLLFVLLLVGFALKDTLHFSSNLLSLFASKESVQNLLIAQKLGYSKEMFVATKGFDAKSKKEFLALKKELENLREIQQIKATLFVPKELREYFEAYKPITSEFDPTPPGKEQIGQKLQKLYNQTMQSFFYTPIDTKDPLGLFRTKSTLKTPAHKGEYLALEGYGYLMKITTNLSPTDVKKAQLLYNRLTEVLKKYPHSIAFAPFFYSVENSRAIKQDVKMIVVLSTLVLLVLYMVLLKNPVALLHVSMTLVSSILFALIVCGLFVEDFSLIALAFGTSLSAVSIDYFFHHYFHKYYLGGKKPSASVLYGYATTAAAFLIFSFIPIPLLAQMSLFALLSLSFAYVCFTYLYPYLHLRYVPLKNKENKPLFTLNTKTVFVLSGICIVVGVFGFHFETDVKKLDYQNRALQKKQNLFYAKGDKLHPVLVHAASQNGLLEKLHTLKEKEPKSFSFANFVPSQKNCKERKEQLRSYGFEELKKELSQEAKKVGFRQGYFSHSYDFLKNLPPCSGVNLELFAPLGLYVTHYKGEIYTLALVENIQEALTIKGIEAIDAKTLFMQVANEMLKNIMLYGFLAVAFILGLIYYSTKKRFFFAFGYILFPLSVAFMLSSLGGSVSVIHIFAFIILVAIGIDYGIYMANTKERSSTALAVRFSLISTFGAFGILIVSSIAVLHSIGLVITSGVISIYFLTKVLR